MLVERAGHGHGARVVVAAPVVGDDVEVAQAAHGPCERRPPVERPVDEDHRRRGRRRRSPGARRRAGPRDARSPSEGRSPARIAWIAAAARHGAKANAWCAWGSPPRCPGRIEVMSQDQARVTSPPAGGAFGPNAWLVDDMFEEYRNDPSSVSESWREFFADYVPGGVATAAVRRARPTRTRTRTRTRTDRGAGTRTATHRHRHRQRRRQSHRAVDPPAPVRPRHRRPSRRRPTSGARRRHRCGARRRASRRTWRRRCRSPPRRACARSRPSSSRSTGRS